MVVRHNENTNIIFRNSHHSQNMNNFKVANYHKKVFRYVISTLLRNMMQHANNLLASFFSSTFDVIIDMEISLPVTLNVPGFIWSRFSFIV